MFGFGHSIKCLVNLSRPHFQVTITGYQWFFQVGIYNIDPEQDFRMGESDTLVHCPRGHFRFGHCKGVFCNIHLNSTSWDHTLRDGWTLEEGLWLEVVASIGPVPRSNFT